MNETLSENWTFSDIPYTRPEVKALQARFDDLTRRAKAAASAEELLSHLGLTPGAVSPMGLLNVAAGAVAWYVDEALLAGGRIGLHPNDNTATVWMPTQAMIGLARAHGNPVEVFSPEE